MAAIDEYKEFNDPIHGLVKLHPLLVKIIDTPQFQRLRNIKQLGEKSYVYPGATHSRFEHSIGVAYLAEELVQGLIKNQPELNITPAEKLCVQIAGLCHDLGHGPFSHLYKGMFKPKGEPKDQNDENKPKPWTHETASIEMFDHLVKVNELNKPMEEAGLDLANDLDFIKELINPEHYKKRDKWPFHGRPEDRSFLYEIVANKRNEIDVDKWDYFARDCHYLGMKNSFDYQRLILSARVCEWDNRKEICFRDKEVFNLYDMFYTRFSLHKRAYQHKVAKAIGLMITDAFRIANEHIKISGSVNDKGKVQIFNLDTAKYDMEAYTKLTDNVVEHIRNPQNANAALNEAKELLDRIHSRNLYKCLGEIVLATEEQVRDQWFARIPEGWNPEDFLVDVIKLDYGNGEKDPIQDVRFYRKENPSEAIQLNRDEVSRLLPEKFAEQTVILHYKGTENETLEAATELYRQWRDQRIAVRRLR